jgi:DMSO/TMAO reductase YedYZ molybdopterin-dependent catalytic subunit
MRRSPFSLRLLAALMAGAALTGVWALLYGLSLTPFPPFDLADVVIHHAPGNIATWAIERFGHNAQRLLMTACTVLFAAGWLIAPALDRLIPRTFAIGLTATTISIAALLPALWAEGPSDVARGIWLLLAFGGPAMLIAHRLNRWLDYADALGRAEAAEAAVHWLDRSADISRRDLLRRMLVVALAIGGTGSLSGWLLRRSHVAQPQTAAGMPLSVTRAGLNPPTVAGPFIDAFSAPDGVRQRFTSNADFYVVDISTRDPVIVETDWSLRIRGLVEREITLTWHDLIMMPAVEIDGTLMCISYLPDSDLISTTRWTGVPLRDVLQRVGIQDGAVDLICRGAHGYSDSIPLAKALEATTILAYGMNDTTLPTEHGFPCRLYVPGLYGEKNVKWLHEIELVDYDYLGYWQERGWTDIAIIETMSAIDTPRTRARPDIDGVVPIGGIAFAGSRGISRVEVRVNDRPWEIADLEPYDPELVWQRWRYDWRPQPGRHRLTVRAVDGEGMPQIETEREPHPDGYTGLHSMTVDII